MLINVNITAIKVNSLLISILLNSPIKKPALVSRFFLFKHKDRQFKSVLRIFIQGNLHPASRPPMVLLRVPAMRSDNLH